VVRQTLIRVAAVALALSSLSFAAGVAGDLSRHPSAGSGERVVLRIPPELPADTPRAAPLPPLTPTAAAAEVTRAPRQLRVETPVHVRRAIIVAATKPEPELVFSEVKPDLDRAPKPESA
jgi:hypothetical protein